MEMPYVVNLLLTLANQRYIVHLMGALERYECKKMSPTSKFILFSISWNNGKISMGFMHWLFIKLWDWEVHSMITAGVAMEEENAMASRQSYSCVLLRESEVWLQYSGNVPFFIEAVSPTDTGIYLPCFCISIGHDGLHWDWSGYTVDSPTIPVFWRLNSVIHLLCGNLLPLPFPLIPIPPPKLPLATIRLWFFSERHFPLLFGYHYTTSILLQHLHQSSDSAVPPLKSAGYIMFSLLH